jgi:undecaprenyl-diphosphatase
MPLFAAFDQNSVLVLHSLVDQYSFVRTLFIVLALSGVYVIPIVWLFVWFYRPFFRVLLLSSISAGIVAWQGINNLVQLFYSQNRPVHELPIREWFFERPENAFPSDHIAFLSGITFFLILQKKYVSGLWLLLLSVMVGIARVGVAVHYPSDIVFGFLVGLTTAILLYQLHPWLEKRVWPHVITLAHWLKLA